MIVVEGLDNSGKNTFVANNYPNAIIIEFPIRNGLHSNEINKFLLGEIEYSEEVETWFLENRLDWYKNKYVNGVVLIRSGISYLVYKWFRTGIEPTNEEINREKELLKYTKIIFLETSFVNPGKMELYDDMSIDKKIILTTMFKKMIKKIIK